jgi:two-component system cell cycle response regulator DivK
MTSNEVSCRALVHPWRTTKKQGGHLMSDVHILYIEDEPGNRMLVRRILEAEGFFVSEATNGLSGLEIATQTKPDLILLDINLPEIDGYDLAKRFRETPNLSEVPILAITANVMHGDRERTLEAGCDGYIQKPIDVDQLPEQVRAALNKNRT